MWDWFIVCLSVAASNRITPHVHELKDDLESLLYVVLYCALLWLPVETSLDLDWWLTGFFSIPKRGRGAVAISKD